MSETREAYELYHLVTGKSFGRPRGSLTAAQKRMDKVNETTGHRAYGVRPIRISAGSPEGQPDAPDTRTDAIAATRAAYLLSAKIIPQPKGSNEYAAWVLEVADAHKFASGLWSEVAEADGREPFALFLAEMHDNQETAWLEDA